MTGEDYEASKDEHDPAHPQYHLPECWHNEERRAYVCICDRLRACEQRVREEMGDPFGRAGWNKGYRDALDTARDAVAALRRTTFGSDPAFIAMQAEALAAIDALKGDTDV